MEKKKISFKIKGDVEMQKQSHWEKCNYDCTQWMIKSLAHRLQNSTSPCYTAKTAKGNIWW